MARVEYNVCDRCQERIRDGFWNAVTITHLAHRDRTLELCNRCSTSFRKWLREGEPNV